MTPKKYLPLAFSLVVFLHGGALAYGDESFGSRVSIREFYSVSYPGFTITSLGQRKNGFYPGTERRLAPIYDFKVESIGYEKIVSFSQGTGDIAPTPFIVQSKCYALEVRHREGFALFGGNDLIVNEVALEFCK